MSGAPRAEFLSVATVRKPHGVRGEVVVALETDRPKPVFRAGRVLQLGDASGRPVGRNLTVERARPFQDGMLVKFEELQGRTPELEELRGRTLLIPAHEAAPAAQDEVHYRELVGMRVLDRDQEVGRIREVLDSPGGELLAVRRPGRPELLLPFVREWTRAVDREAGELRLELPEGLLDL